MPDTYTYRFGIHEFPTIAEAQRAALVKHDVRVWNPKFYDKCEYHGDSMIGIAEDGKTVLCEIIFLMNGRHCNPWDDKRCGYEEHDSLKESFDFVRRCDRIDSIRMRD